MQHDLRFLNSLLIYCGSPFFLYTRMKKFGVYSFIYVCICFCLSLLWSNTSSYSINNSKGKTWFQHGTYIRW